MRLEVRKKDGMQGLVMMKGGQEGDVSAGQVKVAIRSQEEVSSKGEGYDEGKRSERGYQKLS